MWVWLGTGGGRIIKCNYIAFLFLSLLIIQHMNIVACKVCGNTTNNEIFSVREMYLGIREKFLYQKCGNCGFDAVLDIPGNLSKYYPLDKYYSLKNEDDKKLRLNF